jgi:hypothetical protein
MDMLSTSPPQWRAALPAFPVFIFSLVLLEPGCAPDYAALSSGGAASTCSNQQLDALETDVDCGGTCATSRPCANGKSCVSSTDCASDACSAGKCVVPSCTDQVLDQTESDIDCGGGCDGCEVGKICVDDADCASGSCKNQRCVALSCSDGERNQNEMAIDCGGICSSAANGYSRCPLGSECNVADDCQSGICNTAFQCASPATVPAELMIDDMEDGDRDIIQQLGRHGPWTSFDDGTGVREPQVLVPERLAGGRAESAYAIHQKFTGMTFWGGGFGVDLNVDSGVRHVYDASAYTGFGFWGRSLTGAVQPIVMLIPNRYTDTAAAADFPGDPLNCTPNTGTTPANERCDDHYAATLLIAPQWAYYKVYFADMRQRAFGKPGPTIAPDTSAIYSIHVNVEPNQNVDLMMDDLAFLID